MDNKVYLVTFDGYMDTYGSYVYLYGIYTTKDEAEKASERLKDKIDQEHQDSFLGISSDAIDPIKGRKGILETDKLIKINEVKLNEALKVGCDRWGDYYSLVCLGGYAE